MEEGLEVTLTEESDVKPRDCQRSVTKHISHRLSREIVSEFPSWQVTLSQSVASCRLQSRQPPWIKDGRHRCGNERSRNKLAWPSFWPATNDSNIWFPPLSCWSAAPERVKQLSAVLLMNQHKLILREISAPPHEMKHEKTTLMRVEPHLKCRITEYGPCFPIEEGGNTFVL